MDADRGREREREHEHDRLLRRAIAERRVVRLHAGARVRIAEPHDYGIRNGVAQLLAFQLAGDSASGRLPGWRWLRLTDLTRIELTEQTFAGNRPAPSGRHSRWDELFVRVATPR
jgi:hypothetical protein